jgi:hypothetical protein
VKRAAGKRPSSPQTFRVSVEPKCLYCGSTKDVHCVVLPKWGEICDLCEEKKYVEMYAETLAIAKVRYDEAVARLRKLEKRDCDVCHGATDRPCIACGRQYLCVRHKVYWFENVPFPCCREQEVRP